MITERTKEDYYILNTALVLEKGMRSSFMYHEHDPNVQVNGNKITVTFPSGAQVTLTVEVKP